MKMPFVMGKSQMNDALWITFIPVVGQVLIFRQLDGYFEWEETGRYRVDFVNRWGKLRLCCLKSGEIFYRAFELCN